MIDKTSVQNWLEKYINAWKTYDPQDIGALFSDNAEYLYGPYHTPVQGREAIIANWLEHRDALGTYEAGYEPLAVDGNLAVINGRSRYFESDGTTHRTEFDNIFVLHFDDEGRCTRFCEWYMERPKE